MEAELTADSHGHVSVYLYISNIDLGAGPDLGNTYDVSTLYLTLPSTHPDAHELGPSVIVSFRPVEAQHGRQLGDVVRHREAGVASPGDAGQTPELAVIQLRKRGER